VKLRPEHLKAHLGKELAPLYLVFGDETLLVQEAADAVREAARERNYTERECLTVEAKFDWNGLLLASNSLSLFGQQRLLELRLGTAKPGDAGAKALQAYAERPAEGTVLLITAGRLDPTTQRSRWFAVLEKVGVAVQIWPVNARQLPGWIQERMHRRGLRPTADAVTLLCERVEGNLLAAAQEIDKLFVLYGAGSVTVEQLLAVVGDSARYNVYDLVDAALAGQDERVVRILDGLRQEGVEATLVSWALQREIRLLASLSFDVSNGTPVEAALGRNKVWEKRKPLLRGALSRLHDQACRRLLGACARVDRLLKGAGEGEGDAWDELLSLSLSLAGKPLFKGCERPFQAC
jgi:DNA polymerase-3 subunit delta